MVDPWFAQTELKLHFGAQENELGNAVREAGLTVPVLGEERLEQLPPLPAELQVGSELVELQPSLEDLEAQTEAVYTRMLQSPGSAGLCRIWNYLPQINAHTGALENYRAFCRGRARAFEHSWGTGFTRRLPAASAVGGPPGVLAVVALAAPVAPFGIENPEQVPAYQYPAEHGPRSPSFCRAMRAPGREHDWVFISGTAAIKGHRSVAPGQLAPQIDCTIDNLRLVSSAAAVGADLGAAQGWKRQFKVYLRRRGDFAEAAARLRGALLRDEDSVVWLEADICRAELEIEIEATLWRKR